MSIPLDNLYNFLDALNNDDIVIYRFFPHGSKKLSDLCQLKLEDGEQKWPYFKRINRSTMICHDQEPLSYDLYDGSAPIQQMFDEISAKGLRNKPWIQQHKPGTIPLVIEYAQKFNLRAALDWAINLHDDILLVHSEQRSIDLQRYEQNGFIGVYWWAHAIIARDWFRYAQHDTKLDHRRPTDTIFLIYNRAWSGSREYRLKFTELLVQYDLQNACQMRFNPVDQNTDYHDHVFKNTDFKIETMDLETRFPLNTAVSSDSASYEASDYQNTQIEIVLETLFDDQRLHLTEKVFRPIACGQPFVIAATQGALAYIRSYGFQTFHPWIDETYDSISDPKERLVAIAAEMQRITNMDASTRQKIMTEIRKIALHNKALFFSDHWHQSVIKEYQQNLVVAKHKLQTRTKGKLWIDFRKFLKKVDPSNMSWCLMGLKVFWGGKKELVEIFQWLRNHNNTLLPQTNNSKYRHELVQTHTPTLSPTPANSHPAKSQLNTGCTNIP